MAEYKWLDAGARRSKIIIEQQDGYELIDGEQVPRWAAYKTARAKIVHAHGSSFFASDTPNTKHKAKFNIRYAKGIDTAMRINHKGIIYEIAELEDIQEMHKELEIMGVCLNEYAT